MEFLAPEKKEASFEEFERLLDSFLELTENKSRRIFFSEHTELRSAAWVLRLADEVVRLVRVDIRQADSLAATALWLAKEVGDEYCWGRSQRAAAIVYHFKGEHETALGYYEAALRCFEQLARERDAAITRSNALLSLSFLGEHKKAFRWAEAAKKIFKKIDDRLRLARLEGNLGNILLRQDRWEEAAGHYEAAYEEFRALGETSDMAISLRNMAVCHVSLNNFLQALGFYEQARRYCRETAMPAMETEIDYNIAYLHYLRGEYTRAIELYQATRKRCEELGETYHVALCDLDQAEMLLELNLVDEANELAQRAYASFEAFGMPYESAKALTNLAITASRGGKAFLAVELFTKAREIFVSDGNQVWPALLDLYKAHVMFNAGRPLEAARLARSALEGFADSSLPKKSAMCESLLAKVHLERGEYQKGRQCCESALRRLVPLDAPALEHQIYLVLGQVEEADADRDSACESYRLAQRSLERLRSHVQAEELKVTFSEDKLAVYENLVSLTLESQIGGEEKSAAFSDIEKAKARSLADMMAFRAHALPPTGATRSGQAEMVRKLREELNWYYRQIDLQEMRGGDRSVEEVKQLHEFSRKQEDHLIRTLSELERTDREFSSLQEAATVDLTTIQSEINADSLLVEYYIARGIVYACIVSGDSLEIVPVTVASRAHELHRLLRFQLSKFDLGSEYVDQFAGVINEATRKHLYELYLELIAPIREQLKAERLIIVPHGFLHNLPFQALFDGDRFLSDSYLISYVPSASVFYLCSSKKSRFDESALVLGVGNGDGSDIAEHARAAAEVLPESRLLLGEEASEAALRREGENSRIVYLGSEGNFRSDNPIFSSIKLGTSRLSIFDLFSLKLSAEVVILNGCGAGLVGAGSGDETVGLTRGFLYAGAQSVLTTLWDVGGNSTKLFVTSFCRRLQEGVGAVDAQQAAMLEVREEYPHPFYWAPFVLVGKA